MSHNMPRTKVIYDLDNIDATKNGPSSLVIFPYQKFYPTDFIVEVISSNAITSVPEISLGVASFYDNIIEKTALAGMMNSSQIMSFNLTGLRTSVQPGAHIFLNVVEEAKGNIGLNYLIRCILSGILI